MLWPSESRIAENGVDRALLMRLRRANGHLRSLIRMVAEGADLRALAPQFDAVAAALAKARRELLLGMLAQHAESKGSGRPGLSREERAALVRLL